VDYLDRAFEGARKWGGGRPHDSRVGDKDTFCMWDVCSGVGDRFGQYISRDEEIRWLE
jgi:hypothetical protein